MFNRGYFIRQLEKQGPLGQVIDDGRLAEWDQRAPKKLGMLTFAHTAGIKLVQGLVVPTLSEVGFDISYRAQSGVSFNGLWSDYEKPGVATDKKFDEFRIGDSYPNQMVLFAQGEEVRNTLSEYALNLAIYAAFVNIAEKGETLALELNRTT